MDKMQVVMMSLTQKLILTEIAKLLIWNNACGNEWSLVWVAESVVLIGMM
jgi:hypothetical protein